MEWLQLIFQYGTQIRGSSLMLPRLVANLR